MNDLVGNEITAGMNVVVMTRAFGLTRSHMRLYTATVISVKRGRALVRCHDTKHETTVRKTNIIVPKDSSENAMLKEALGNTLEYIEQLENSAGRMDVLDVIHDDLPGDIGDWDFQEYVRLSNG